MSENHRKPRPAINQVEAAALLRDAPDTFLFTPETTAAILGFDTVKSLEKQRFIGVGPEYVKVGRLVRYPAGKVREYLANLPPQRLAGAA